MQLYGLGCKDQDIYALSHLSVLKKACNFQPLSISPSLSPRPPIHHLLDPFLVLIIFTPVFFLIFFCLKCCACCAPSLRTSLCWGSTCWRLAVAGSCWQIQAVVGSYRSWNRRGGGGLVPKQGKQAGNLLCSDLKTIMGLADASCMTMATKRSRMQAFEGKRV